MRLLFICNTYMQLLSALRIKTELYSDYEADLILSDHSLGAKRTADNIGDEEIFKIIKFCDTKFFTYEQSWLQDLIDVFRVVIGGGKKYKRYLPQVEYYYSKIFYYNLDAIVFMAFDVSIRRGYVPECVLMEETVGGSGIILQGRIRISTRIVLARKIRNLLGKKDVYNETRMVYSFNPDIYPKSGQINVASIPQIDRNDDNSIALFKRVFSYEFMGDFPETILFFGSSADIDGYSICESDFIIDLFQKMNPGSIRIKPHPRDGRDVYKKAGISIMESSDVPWEVMQLTTDFSKHIFVTTGSSSLINAASMFEDAVETYMIYPIFRDRDERYYQFMENLIRPTLVNLQSIGKCRNITIIENEDEWEKVLDMHFQIN